ncbi:carboxymuconolactone decarboxylase family protein [Methanoregula sp.]|uniref:carboxymuconolactone decarboxylase family protein n=1 Tax=Methanoregula sp. TaxID=2052170 RepID=UPI002CB785B2|nr:carboxymuconolactone decarboxylase family protein [Methanoregula sp.]HVP95671.1 carboxymuconolactone decarboxylase family protein [Methanoregula sp.]
MGRRQEDEFEDRLRKIVEQGADATAEEWLKIIEREYGKIPLIFQRMAERPEVLISHLLYKGSVAETSSLDPKYVELISMAVGAALKCQYCTSYHMQAAIRMGATREEILEVILLSGMISNSSVLANAYRVIDERLARCFPCDVMAVKDQKAQPKRAKAGRKKK